MMNRHSQKGFSLTEACIVCLVLATVAAMAIPAMDDAIRGSNADAAAQLISQQLSYARSVAIGTHQPVLVEFSPADNTVVAARGSGSMRGPMVLPGRMQIQTAALGPATPDNLATVLGAGQNLQVCFLDNGSAVDGPATNNLLSGTVYLQHPNGDLASRRAITLLGGTGRIHIWRYDTQTNTWR